MRRFALLILVAVLSACTMPEPPGNPLNRDGFDPEQSAANFREVVERVKPVAEAECRRRAPKLNCNFIIAVDNSRRQPINAYQFQKGGRPVIGFTIPLIADARNKDELAFIMGHEAAHHIAGHLDKRRQSAATAAALFKRQVETIGGSRAAARQAARLGAQVGALQFSKEFELEADALGTIIAKRAGFDPLRGVAFFTRVPDPADRFLSTHPNNADRIRTVRRAARGVN